MRGFWQSKLQTLCPEYHVALKGINTGKVCVQLFATIMFIAFFQVQNKKLALVFVLASFAWYLTKPISQSPFTFGWWNIPVFIAAHFRP